MTTAATEKQVSVGAPTSPKVSVVMPVRNEERWIRRSLGAVLAQDYPEENVEIIVADGMSTDATRAIVEEFRAEHPRVRLVDNPGRIAPTAMNAALAVADGDIIVRVDGHCEIACDYVTRCVQHLIGDEVDGVGGPIETVGETYISQVIAAAMSSTFGVGGALFRTSRDVTRLADTVPFPAYTRRILEKAGPYDEELVRNQDDEYNYRLRKLGARILLASDVRSRYYSRGTLRSLAKQYFQYGFWKARVLQKHPRQMSCRQFVPPLFVLTLISLSFARPFTALASWPLGAVLVAYALATAAASAQLAARHRWHDLFILPLVFAIIHITYGVGFLIGLVRFAARWTVR